MKHESLGGGGGHEIPHHNFVVIAAMIMKLDTGIKLDVILQNGNKNVCDFTTVT